jgi:hypothetical protein
MSFMDRLKAKISGVAAELRDEEVTRPWWVTACVIAARVVPSSLLHVRVVAITRAQSIPTFRARVDVRYRRLKPEDLRAEFGSGKRSADPVYKRAAKDLRHADEVFVAELDEKIVAYIMVARQDHYIPEVRFDLPLRPDQACTSRSYVDPAHRRYSGVYPGLASFLYSEVSRDGVRSFLGYAVILNRYSMRMHRRLGYDQVGWVALLQVPFGSLQVSRLDFDGGRLRWRRLPRHGPSNGAWPAPEVVGAHQGPNAGLRREQ